jgi:hypothetical protein
MKRTIFVMVVLCGLLPVAWATSQGDLRLPKNASDYEHINTLFVPDEKLPVFGIHHFYMNDKGLPTFSKSQGKVTYPDGTIILGRVYDVVLRDDAGFEEGKLLAYTYMEKDKDNPMTKVTGGWIFAKFSPDGKRMDINPAADCFPCHAPLSQSDFVFSDPLKR